MDDSNFHFPRESTVENVRKMTYDLLSTNDHVTFNEYR